MTDNDIIKALEHCIDSCNSLCPLHKNKDCRIRLCLNALDLINRQKAELAELKSENKILKDSNINLQELYEAEKERVAKAKEKCIGIAKALKTAKAEAVKEVLEKLKEKYAKYETYETLYAHYIWHDIDNLLKEMVGDEFGICQYIKENKKNMKRL